MTFSTVTSTWGEWLRLENKLTLKFQCATLEDADDTNKEEIEFLFCEGH